MTHGWETLREKVVAKTATAEIRVQLTQSLDTGAEIIMVRRWWLSDKGEWLPTRKGIGLAPDAWHGVIAAITELMKDEESTDLQP